MKTTIAAVLLSLCLPSVTHAHFLWLLTESAGDAPQVQVFFGESAEPDDPDLLDRVSSAKVWSVGFRGEPQTLALKKIDESLVAELTPQTAQTPIVLRHTWGVFTRGESSFLLNYYAKTYPFALPGTWRAIDDAERLPLEIVPERDGRSTVLRVEWQGKPVAGCQVVIVGPGIEDKREGTTDEAGGFRTTLPESGVYSIRARMIEEKPGELDETKYSARRHYSTLTLRHVPSQITSEKHSLPELPRGITSFGGAVIGDTAYAYGGNYGSAHEYSQEGQSGDLWSLDLSTADGEPGQWRKLSTGPKRQGLALVAHNGLLYRVGGFMAKNHEGEDNDLQSQSDVARFDPRTGNWTVLPPLPEPRSSHDAASVGDVLYVAGGWNMPGAGKETVWHNTAWALDLSVSDSELKWQPIAKPPFQRRALALAAHDEKLYCIGGMRQQGGPTTRCDVYDPATDSWSAAPSLLGTNMDGFGSSAFACDGSLYVSTISGSVQRLSKDEARWNFVGQLDHPRFFHRLLPWRNEKLLAIGGGSMSVGKVTAVDLISWAK